MHHILIGKRDLAQENHLFTNILMMLHQRPASYKYGLSMIITSSLYLLLYMVWNVISKGYSDKIEYTRTLHLHNTW